MSLSPSLCLPVSSNTCLCLLQLALKHHPDKNPDQSDAAKEQFQGIAQAYKTLSDPWKRKYYEETGSVEDIDMQAESYMAAFVEMVDEMVGGVPIKTFFSEMMGLDDMVHARGLPPYAASSDGTTFRSDRPSVSEKSARPLSPAQDEDDLASMPPFPFPGELFPVGTLPKV